MPVKGKVVVFYLLLIIVILGGAFAFGTLLKKDEGESVFLRTKSVDVYFQKEPDNLCENVSSLRRRISSGQGSELRTLRELFQGPTDKEKDQGFRTNIDVDLLDLRIDRGTAYITVSRELSEDPCLGIGALRQIEKTLLQFPSIKEVVISPPN